MQGFVEVDYKQFFAAIGGPEDIHPRSGSDRSVWADQHTRKVAGISTPGYMCRGPDGKYTEAKRYYLTPEFAAKNNSK